MNKNVTVKEFAESQRVDLNVANAILRWLTSEGAIKIVGQAERAPGARGKAADIFEVPNELTIVFWQDAPAEPAAEPAPEMAAPPVETVSATTLEPSQVESATVPAENTEAVAS